MLSVACIRVFPAHKQSKLAASCCARHSSEICYTSMLPLGLQNFTARRYAVLPYSKTCGDPCFRGELGAALLAVGVSRVSWSLRDSHVVGRAWVFDSAQAGVLLAVLTPAESIEALCYPVLPHTLPNEAPGCHTKSPVPTSAAESFLYSVVGPFKNTQGFPPLAVPTMLRETHEVC